MDNQKLNQAVNLGQQGLIRYTKKQYGVCKDKCLKACEKLQPLLHQAKSDKRKQIIKEFIEKYLKGAENADAMLKNRSPIHQQKTNTHENYKLVDNPNKNLHNNYQQNTKKNNINQNNKDQYIKQVEQNMMEVDHSIHFNDIVGLEQVKKTLKDTIINPSLRPDLYKGVRAPPRGILFYGPPGNGKTMLAKAVAAECNSTFFNVSASSLLSKWVGDSEKVLKALFLSAYNKQPSIIFIDQIDSILTKRNEDQNEASRRLKTQFLVRLDGATTTDQDQVLIIGATNLPNELDKAALRRFNKKILIDMPDLIARKSMITKSLKNVNFKLSDNDITQIAMKLEMYSASDIKNIIKDAAMMPIRQLQYQVILKINKNDIRPIVKKDFEASIKSNPPTLNKKQYQKYRKFGNDNIKQEKVGDKNQQGNQSYVPGLGQKALIVKKTQRYHEDSPVRQILDSDEQKKRSLQKYKYQKTKTINFTPLNKYQQNRVTLPGNHLIPQIQDNLNNEEKLNEPQLNKSQNKQTWYKRGYNLIRKYVG